ncbi:MAG: triose-phosphate isomerase [Kiritimatiellae bacterium]|nr:triose-phosphate isomerase [Kiritimatiellia bacterium]
MRKKIVAGNWKMNMTTAEAASLVTALKGQLAGFREADVVVCPPFTAIETVSRLVQGTNIDLGAQNMHWEKSGAFTGEISPAMLRELYCHYVILGHSERRQYFHEDDAIVNRKVRAAHSWGLRPIVCVGETLEQREAGQVEAVVSSQVRGSLDGLSQKEMLDTIVAYEPVWAIGTGKTATSAQAQEVHALIRATLASMFDAAVAQGVRIQYGGSVKPGNARELFSMPDIDGGLIGGAALDAKSFVDIVRAAI